MISVSRGLETRNSSHNDGNDQKENIPGYDLGERTQLLNTLLPYFTAGESRKQMLHFRGALEFAEQIFKKN